MGPLELSRADARRVAVRAQALTADRPDGLLDAVDRVSLLQLNPTAAIAPSADLVLWSRLGSSYDPRDLEDAVATHRLFDLRNTLRPATDLPLYRAEMAEWPGPPEGRGWQVANARWLHDNRRCRDDILDTLRADGPLPAGELPDTCVRPWRSSGWNNSRNVTMMLDLLTQTGDVAVAGWDGRTRLWDLADRVYPFQAYPDVVEARRLRDERRLHALGIARSRGPQCPVEPLDVGEAGEPAVIEGVRGSWRVDPVWLDAGPARPRVALLSPFDRLLHDRKRMTEIFEFEYALEMFKPAAARRWGYYALPVLVGDRLVGKLDATADSARGVLRVDALHLDTDLTADEQRAVDDEITDLARWLDLRIERA
ncbi:DNA glycosylase AlkZ-like family protein [Cellulomonas sp. HZM]|uniref:DNA glycosylase AlkZ-like family protein n=1 Tax=Cellulomonas sp. HZM TaxID=1454010 RepID=UPI0004938287|nr:crosslink repair DNA glycosylase YcaQ family protein [Cellulomonas sp. HZM]